MSTSPYHISSLLDKMSSVDKDFRFMATNDLITELQRDSIKLDDDSERKVVLAILKLVQDKNGEVQNLAVRCLGPLIRKVKDVQVTVIINELCTNMFSDDERLRDISSVGLKTVILQLPHVNQLLSNAACKNITEQLLKSIDNTSLNQYILLECLDILSDLIHHHGVVLASFHEQLLHSLLPMLVDPRPVSVRKRACTALCYLSSCCQQELYDYLLTQVIKTLDSECQSQSSFINVRTFLHCVGAISRQSGQRVNSYLPAILPLLMHFVSSEDDELKEACLQAFEVLVCFREISSHLSDIINVALTLLAHDPNYNYDSDDEQDCCDDEMETEDIDEEEDDSYSDDDDISWKVRRASAKCVSAIVIARPDMITEFYTRVSPVLITRFKEREETVKSDIFQAYRMLLNVTKSSIRVTDVDQDHMETSESPLSLLHNQVPSIVKALHKQLKDKSIKTRQGCFGLLTDLVLILHESLRTEIGSLVPGIIYCLNDTTGSSNMKIDCLVFLNAVCTYHSPCCIHPHVDLLIPAVIKCVDDTFYKITSEALLVLQNLVKIIRPLDSISTFDYTPYANTIYTTAMNRLSAADIDQEVKERAIGCMGQVIANLGDILTDQLSQCLPVYVNRLKNEITRLTTVKALTMITKSSLKIDISSIKMDTIPLLATFLRKNHRDLRLATLVCLNQLLVCYSIPDSLIEGVLIELPQLISDNDLHISQQVLMVICTIMTVNIPSTGKIKDAVLPNVTKLLLSSLLQGSALITVANFFSQLVSLDQPGLQFKDTFQMLVQLVQVPEDTPSLHRQTYYSISRCIAQMCTQTNTLTVVQKFVQDIESSSTQESSRLLALFTIGEIGKYTDLSSIDNIKTVIIDLFIAPSEEIRTAASYTLGCVCAGNLESYLPFILTQIQTSPKKQYLLLHSLKEIITCYGNRKEGYMPFKPYVGKIWDVLFLHFQTLEEGTRNVVAECVGKLTLVEPTTLLPLLKDNLGSSLPHVRSTVITALKYTISDQPLDVDTQLSRYIGEFMTAISDPDLNVRRVALVAFNSAAHNKPSLIRDLLDTILPNLYNETKVRKELIRQVEMGPFKHTVDDGLDLRKAAFECMYTLLETCLDRLDTFEFLNHVEDGLRDHYDIKMLTFLLLVRVSHVRPSIVLQRIDRLVEPLRATVQSRVKANSVKQEFEKQEEMKRSAIRTVVALLAIPDAGKNPQLTEFLQQIKSNPETAAIFQSIQQDSSRRKSTTTGDEPMEL